MKKKLIAGFGSAALLVAATTGVASADAPDPTGFVCPVISFDGAVGAALDAGESDHGLVDTGNFLTVLGPEVPVPTGATN
jgi:hypothetical protein